jgi:hypothetical protein
MDQPKTPREAVRLQALTATNVFPARRYGYSLSFVFAPAMGPCAGSLVRTECRVGCRVPGRVPDEACIVRLRAPGRGTRERVDDLLGAA